MDSKPSFNNVFDLAAFITYNSERPVFKSVVDTPYGGVNLIALRGGQQLAEHTAPSTVCIYLLEGETEFVVHAHPRRLIAGQCMLMEAGVPHYVNAVSDCKILLIKLDN